MSRQPGDQQDPRYASLVSQYGARPPVNNGIIEYARAEPRRLRNVQQFFLGLLAPIVFLAFMWATLAAVMADELLFSILAWLLPVTFLGVVIYVRLKYEWRAFFAGVLTLILGAPLGVGIVCAVICSM